MNFLWPVYRDHDWCSSDDLSSFVLVSRILDTNNKRKLASRNKVIPLLMHSFIHSFITFHLLGIYYIENFHCQPCVLVFWQFLSCVCVCVCVCMCVCVCVCVCVCELEGESRKESMQCKKYCFFVSIMCQTYVHIVLRVRRKVLLYLLTGRLIYNHLSSSYQKWISLMVSFLKSEF